MIIGSLYSKMNIHQLFMDLKYSDKEGGGRERITSNRACSLQGHIRTAQ